MRNCAKQARLRGGEAIEVTDDEHVLKAFNMTADDVERAAPLFECRNKVVLVIKF
jgi:hypothetical protein